MKRISYILLITLVTILAGCSKKYDYTDVIPRDASMVISVDFNKLYQKSNIDKSGNGKIFKSQLDNLIKDFFSNMDEDDINSILHNPNQTGIDFTNKGYVFIGRESKTYGLLFKVSNKKNILKFDSSKNQISFKKEHGYNVFTSDNFIIIFNDTAFLVLSSNYPTDESLRQYAFSLMEENKEKECPAELKSLFDKQDDLSAYFDMNFIPDGMISSARMGMSGELLLKDLKFITTANFETGKIDVLIDNITEESNLVEIFEKYSKAFSPMGDKFLDMFPSNTLLYVGTRLKGSVLHQLLQENPAISYALTNSDIPLDMNRVLSSIQGDVTIGIHSLENRTFSLYAEVNDSFLDDTLTELQTFVGSAQGMASIQKVSDNLYLFQAFPFMKLWFGGYRNVFFITNSAFCSNFFGEPYKVSLKQKKWSENIQGNIISGAIDINKLLKDADVSPYNQTAIILQPFDYISFFAHDWKQLHLELVSKDKSRNVLEQAIDLISNFK